MKAEMNMNELDTKLADWPKMDMKTMNPNLDTKAQKELDELKKTQIIQLSSEITAEIEHAELIGLRLDYTLLQKDWEKLRAQLASEQEKVGKAKEALDSSKCEAEWQVASENLAGNIVKEEFWKGRLHGLLEAQATLRELEGEK